MSPPSSSQVVVAKVGSALPASTPSQQPVATLNGATSVSKVLKNGTPLVVLMLAMLVSGCSSLTPVQRLSLANQTLSTMTQTLTVAVDQKLITDKATLNTIKTSVDAASALLDKAHAQVAAGKTLDVQFWLDQFDAAFTTIQTLPTEREGENLMTLAAIIALISASASAIGPIGDGISKLADIAGKVNAGEPLTDDDVAHLQQMQQDRQTAVSGLDQAIDNATK